MPRTKVPRKNAAKRNRNSVTEEGQAENIRQLEDRFESWKVEEALIHDQCLEKFDTMIKSIITKIPDHILHMTMGELAENPKQFDKSTGRVPLNRTNQGNSTASSSQRSRDTGKPLVELFLFSICCVMEFCIGEIGTNTFLM